MSTSLLVLVVGVAADEDDVAAFVGAEALVEEEAALDFFMDNYLALDTRFLDASCFKRRCWTISLDSYPARMAAGTYLLSQD